MHQQIQPRSADGFGTINSSAERNHSCSQWRRSREAVSPPSQPVRYIRTSRRPAEETAAKTPAVIPPNQVGVYIDAGTVGAVCTAQHQVGASNLTIGHILCSQYAFELVGAWVSTLVPLVSQVFIYTSQAFLERTWRTPPRAMRCAIPREWWT